MTAQEHIVSSLKELSKPITLENIGDTPLEDAILAKVLSKKFRKLKANEQAIEITKKAIAMSVKEGKPIKVNMIFGGNKLWRFKEAPEIDWAELFATLYFLSWMKLIASVYKPGAELEYYSEDVVLETMNNLPPKETDQYSASFRAMLDWLRPTLPRNVFVSYKRYGEEYKDRSEYLAELEEAKAKVFKELGNKLPTLNDQQRQATERNVRLLPGQADDPLWREKAELIHKSIERTKAMERYINDPSMVPACTTPFPGCITVGSTKRSLAKFWVGLGALQKADGDFNEVILTPNQLETLAFDWEDVHIDGLEGKNFSKIRILQERKQ